MPAGDSAAGPPPLRVLLVTKGLDLGGIERIVVDLAVGLTARGVDVEVALVNSERDRLVPPLLEVGVAVHQLDGSDLIGVGASLRLARLIRSGAFDVVHVHGPLPAVVARLSAIGGGPKVITTSHTPWSSLRRSTRAAWRATSQLDAATVSVSSAVSTSLPARIGARTIVIPHGVDGVRIAAARASAETSSGRPSDAVSVVTVASHRDAKNYPNLLRAVRRALDGGVNLRLLTIGDGPALDDHIAFARSLGIDHAVEFIPATDDVLHRIAAADVLVVASDYEGQPIVVAEALALGVPVVATAVGRVPEMVDASVGRVVAPRDPAALGAALAELAGDPEIRAQLGGNARRLTMRSLDDVLDDHITLYERVVGQ